MPQINLTGAFQDVSALGEPRELFLSGVPSGVVVAVEAGASLGAADGVEIGRLSTPNPSTSGAAGVTLIPYPGAAQFLRYRVIQGALGVDGVVWMSGTAAGTPPQINLTDTFQDFSALGEPREVFLAGAVNGAVVVVEAGDSLAPPADTVVEVARLTAPNPSVSGAAGTSARYAGSAQYLRYRVVEGGAPPGTGIWVSGVRSTTTPAPPGPAVGASVVWAPGVVNAAQTWGDVMAIINATAVPEQRVDVLCDDSGGALNVPAGTYALGSRVTFAPAVDRGPGDAVLITVADGAELQGLAGISGALRLHCQASAGAALTLDGTDRSFSLRGPGAVLQNTGAGSAFAVGAGETFTFELEDATLIGARIVELVATATLVMLVQGESVMSTDWVSGAAGTLQLNTDSQQVPVLTSTLFLGTTTVTYFESLPGWSTYADVYVDPATGSDTAVGLSSTTALATIEEHYRRLGAQPLATTFTQTIHLPAGAFTSDLWRLISPQPSGTTVFQGAVSDVPGATGAITAGTVWDPAARTIPSYTVPAVDFTGLQPGDYWVRVVGGLRDGLTCPIMRVASAHVFETCGGEDPTVPYAVDFPQVGDTIQVCQMTRLRPLPVAPYACAVGEVIVNNITIGDQGLTPHVTTFPAAVARNPGCELHTTSVFGCGPQDGSLIYAYGSLLSGTRSYGWLYALGVAFTDNVQFRDRSRVEFDDACIISATGLQLGAGLGRSELLVITAACVSNYPFASSVTMGSRLTLQGGSTLWFDNGPIAGDTLDVVGPGSAVGVGAGAVYDATGTAPPVFVSIGGTTFTLAAFAAAGGHYVNPNNGAVMAQDV